MKPSWFDLPASDTDLVLLEGELRQKETNPGETNVTGLPLHKMWKDDMLWIPLLISGRKFIGRVDLEDESSSDSSNAPLYPLVKWWVASIDESSA
jgi:8-oxo-dGTP diphosphatase/2-hydroxy-dATP diphosphatase